MVQCGKNLEVSLIISFNIKFVGYNDEILDMKFLGSSEHEAVVATNSSLVRLYDLTTMDCQLLSAHSGKNHTQLFSSSPKSTCLYICNNNL